MHVLLHSVPPTLQQATTNPRFRWRLLDTHRQVWGHCSFLLGPDAQGSVCTLQEFISQSCQLYGGVNGDLLQEGLCHSQVYCTQRPCPCSSPLLICTSAGDTQTQFCLSLCVFSGSWCAQGLFELSERLWWVWGLTLTGILPLLSSCWGFSLEI